MPLFTVSYRRDALGGHQEQLSRALALASVDTGYPDDDLFQRFIALETDDFRVDPRYPGLPKDRTAKVILVEVMLSSGTPKSRKLKLIECLIERLSQIDVDPNDVMVFFLETDRESASFGGGVTAPPLVMAASETTP